MSIPEEPSHAQFWEKSIPGRRDRSDKGQRVGIRLVCPCSLKKARVLELKMLGAGGGGGKYGDGRYVGWASHGVNGPQGTGLNFSPNSRGCCWEGFKHGAYMELRVLTGALLCQASPLQPTLNTMYAHSSRLISVHAAEGWVRTPLNPHARVVDASRLWVLPTDLTCAQQVGA